MFPNLVCPSCGAALEENVGSACPFCGSALSIGSSAPTIIAMPKKKKASAQSSAEAMDEIKKLVREGDEAGAAEVASTEFNLDAEAAKTTVDQMAIELKRSGREPKPAPVAEPKPEPPAKAAEPAPSFGLPEEPKKPSNQRNLIIGVVAGVFLCCCCCLPIVGYAIYQLILNR